jgi:hypothetical protein
MRSDGVFVLFIAIIFIEFYVNGLIYITNNVLFANWKIIMFNKSNKIKSVLKSINSIFMYFCDWISYFFMICEWYYNYWCGL